MPDPAMPISRRAFAVGLALTGAFAARARPLDARWHALERTVGGRLGLCAIDATGRVVATHRATEPFLLCSTFKPFLAAALLERVDAGGERLDRAVPVTRGDLVVHSPAVERAVAVGTMTVEALCEAAVVLSDNAAANLLLDRIGGPAGLTRYFRALGGDAARLDRREPGLNRVNGLKDTTSPAAAAAMLHRLLTTRRLSGASQARLEGWMVASPTGRARLRAGWSPDWRAGDKTGTGPRGETNDIAFVDVPGRGRLFVAAYLVAPGVPLAEREAVLAEVAKGVVAAAGEALPD